MRIPYDDHRGRRFRISPECFHLSAPRHGKRTLSGKVRARVHEIEPCPPVLVAKDRALIRRERQTNVREFIEPVRRGLPFEPVPEAGPFAEQ